MAEKKNESSLSPEIAKLSEKLQKDPSSRLFFPLAEEYIKSGMPDEAIMILKDGLKTHPAFSAARASLGKVYLQKGMVAEAKVEFEKVVSHNPDNLMAQKKLAQIYRDEGDVERAKKICEVVLLTNMKDLEMKALMAELEKMSAPAPKPSPVEVASPPVEADPNLSESDLPPQTDLSSSLESHMAVPPPSPEFEEPPPSLAEDQSLVESAPAEFPPLEPPSFMEPPVAAAPPPSAEPFSPADGPAVELPEDPPVMEPEPVATDSAADDDLPEESRVPVVELNLDESSEGMEDEIFSELLGTSPPPKSPSVSPAVTEPVPEQPPQPSEPAPATEGKPVVDGELATVGLAELYIKQGHYEQGIEIYRKILEHDPENSDARQRLEDALALANLLTKRSKEPIPPAKSGEPPSEPGPLSPDQLRQGRIQRLQSWLEQLKRSQHQ